MAIKFTRPTTTANLFGIFVSPKHKTVVDPSDLLAADNSIATMLSQAYKTASAKEQTYIDKLSPECMVISTRTRGVQPSHLGNSMFKPITSINSSNNNADQQNQQHISDQTSSSSPTNKM
jgi:hypothetical protein